jgi:hypothetical protein
LGSDLQLEDNSLLNENHNFTKSKKGVWVVLLIQGHKAVGIVAILKNSTQFTQVHGVSRQTSRQPWKAQWYSVPVQRKWLTSGEESGYLRMLGKRTKSNETTFKICGCKGNVKDKTNIIIVKLRMMKVRFLVN